MVVAYIDRDVFEPIREELLAQGFMSLSVTEASGSLPEPETAGSYRGVAVERNLRPKARVELVVGDEHVDTVTEAVLRLGGERTFIVVLPVEAALPTMTVKGAEEALPAA